MLHLVEGSIQVQGTVNETSVISTLKQKIIIIILHCDHAIFVVIWIIVMILSSVQSSTDENKHLLHNCNYFSNTYRHWTVQYYYFVKTKLSPVYNFHLHFHFILVSFTKNSNLATLFAIITHYMCPVWECLGNNGIMFIIFKYNWSLVSFIMIYDDDPRCLSTRTWSVIVFFIFNYILLQATTSSSWQLNYLADQIAKLLINLAWFKRKSKMYLTV